MPLLRFYVYYVSENLLFRFEQEILTGSPNDWRILSATVTATFSLPEEISSSLYIPPRLYRANASVIERQGVFRGSEIL